MSNFKAFKNRLLAIYRILQMKDFILIEAKKKHGILHSRILCRTDFEDMDDLAILEAQYYGKKHDIEKENWNEFNVELEKVDGKNKCNCPINTPILLKDCLGTIERGKLLKINNSYSLILDNEIDSNIESDSHIVAYKKAKI